MDRAKAIFTGPIDQLISFAEGLLDGNCRIHQREQY